MHMLPLSTANRGYCVFSTNCDPNQNPATTRRISPITTAVWKYSFFQSFLSVAVTCRHSVSVKWLKSTRLWFIVFFAFRRLRGLCCCRVPVLGRQQRYIFHRYIYMQCHTRTIHTTSNRG